MGVNGLWKLLEPVGRPITLESLENKILAVDISVWLNQALYGMRNQQGSTVPNAHLVLLFQRICKLLYYRIKPIFVFDGGVPELKKKTMGARREIRMSARHRARTISEKVLRKYIKSRVIGSVTGRQSQRPAAILSEREPERDLFELPPLPEDKEMKSSSEDESFSQAQPFQDLQSVNIDSEEFKKLPPEIQHEIIVEMHEKSKRHSRYQAIDMPEASDDFSSFQLTHLLKRGRLTQRLGTIRKEMNDRRVGEVVVDMADSGVGRNSIIMSEKIMSEETGHYILIKRPDTSKPEPDEGVSIDADNEVEQNSMAGGFFPEDVGNRKKERPVNLPIKLPQVSTRVAEASVSHALDDNASSTDGGSSMGHGFQDVADLSVLSPCATGDANISGTDRVVSASLVAEPSLEAAEDLSTITNNNNKARFDDTEQCDTPVTPEANEDKGDLMLDTNSDMESPELAEEESTDTVAEIKPSHCESRSQGVVKEVINVEETVEELDDLEKEIIQRKQLIEALLSRRGPVENGSKKEQVVLGSESSEENSGGEPDSLKLSNASNKQEVCSSEKNKFHSEINRGYGPETVSQSTDHDLDCSTVAYCTDEAPSICIMESPVEKPSAVNEFKGITYEELGEMHAKLDEDLDNLKEERSRQNRLAATVSDEMYKDSQELLQLFGIPYVVSPMEAEAQCAALNSNNLCEGSITEDSDIMLFGGKKVYKNVFNQNRNAELYQDDDVKCVLGLDRQSLITIALLTGSDYTEGVQGIGIVSAMEVIHEFAGKGIEKLKNLKNWLNEPNKRSDASQDSKLKSKLRNISLPVGFPSEQVFDAYLNPAIDDSSETFSWAKPDLHSLRLYASEKLGWSKSKTDEILLPVLKRMNSVEVQPKIDAFFPVVFSEAKRIKSRRVKRVVNRLLNKDQDDDDRTENKHKTNIKRRKRKKPQSSETLVRNCEVNSCSVSKHDTSDNRTVAGKSSEPHVSTATEDLPGLPDPLEKTENSSSTDSTSDTSDDDTTYAPYKKIVISTRGRRGGRGGSRGPRRIARQTSVTKRA